MRRVILGVLALALVFSAGAEEWSEYVPVKWTGTDVRAQVKALRRLHDDYGFKRFVLIGPFQQDEFKGTTLKDYEQLGDSIAWARKELADLTDVELGWWIVPTLRAGDGKLGDPMVNSNGTCVHGNCPLSPAFTADLKAKVSACVQRGLPRIVFIEDDYTFCNKPGQTKMKGCFCSRHLEAFAARVGKTYTGAEIAALYDHPTEENRPLRTAFAEVTRDSLATLAREVRATIDALDPTIRTCLCQADGCEVDGDDTEVVARAFAGQTRPMVRICGASYMNESIASSLPKTTAHLFWSAQHLPKDIELIHETDPYPHTRFYASSYFLGSELCAALMAGAGGSYYYCLPYVDEPLEDDGYAAWMRTHRAQLDVVRATRAGMKPCGIRVVYTPAEVYLRRGHERKGFFGGLPHAVQFLAKMGFPYTTDEDAATSVLFGDVAEILSDDAIRTLLKKGVLLDGEAATILTKRGYADLIGCTAEPMPASISYVAEEIQPVAECRAKGRRLMTQRTAAPAEPSDNPPFTGRALLKPKAGTEVWSQYVDWDGQPVAPSVTFCRNALGGRVGVMDFSPAYGYGFDGGTFHFRKQELFHRLFAKLSEGTLDVSAPQTPSTWVLAAKSDDELLVMVENLCGEPRADVELAFAETWWGGRLSRLTEDGTWVQIGVVGERYRLAESDYYPQKPVFFKVSLKEGPKAASISVQFDAVDRAEVGCASLLQKAKEAGAESVQLERCEFYLDGERRAKALATLSDEIRFFEKAGYPVALWISSLGYDRMTDPDFLRRFPDYQPLQAFNGWTTAVCSTDARWRSATAENVRDFVRAGAKTILFDDDLVQACRPGICCVCAEHRRRIAERLGVPLVTAEQIRAAYTGAPNPLRSAAIDVMGESLMDFCRAMRTAADEVDPSVKLAICLSISHYDLDGVDVPSMIRLLSGAHSTGHLFVRLSGAPYWVCDKNNPRNWGQGLGGVVEYLRWQSALLRREGFVPLDENDPYPRDTRIVPEGLCEAYDRAVIAEGGIIRNKYILRHNAKTGKGMDGAYFSAHLKGQDEAKQIAAHFKDATPIGFEVWAPPHLVREATLPTPFIGMNDMLKFFAQPLAGILLAANGAPTRYDRDSGAPLAAFGPAAASLPEAGMKRGVLLDREGARILKARGIEMGSEPVSEVEGWRLFVNAKGEKFAVSDKDWFDLDAREASATVVPVRAIWRFFTGEEIPVCLTEAKGVHLLAKRRADGTLAVLLNNMRGESVGPFTLTINGVSQRLTLPAYGARIL